MIRLLTFTNLYPDPVRPRHGIFVEHRLRQLLATGQVSAQVIAPVPWCPLPLDVRFPQYRVRGIPERDERYGIVVHHPRYQVLPGVSTAFNPWSMARAAWPVVQQLLREGYEFDVVDAQYVFPDGMAGVLLARKLGKPVILTARGTDVNLALRQRVPRCWLNWADRYVAGYVAVSAALKQGLMGVGIKEEKIVVARNGVDLDLFKPGDRTHIRQSLGLHSPTLLSVGNLVELKGHHLVLEALAELSDAQLIVIGDGPDAAQLKKLAVVKGVSARVRWITHLTQAELADYYTAADLTVLASSREGMANVLLESLACGTPVVASNVGGNPEVVADQCAGRLLPERSAAAIVDAVRLQLTAPIDREAVRHYAQRFGWQVPVAQQLKLLQQVRNAA